MDGHSSCHITVMNNTAVNILWLKMAANLWHSVHENAWTISPLLESGLACDASTNEM